MRFLYSARSAVGNTIPKYNSHRSRIYFIKCTSTPSQNTNTEANICCRNTFKVTCFGSLVLDSEFWSTDLHCYK